VLLPAEEESLFDAGVRDSFGMIEFIATLENDLTIRVPDEHLVASNFDTIAKIRSYLRGRLEE
jgi:acyl carrier protein